MKRRKQHVKINDKLESGNIFSFIIFGFMKKVLVKGYSKELEIEDLYELDENL